MEKTETVRIMIRARMRTGADGRPHVDAENSEYADVPVELLARLFGRLYGKEEGGA